MTSSQTKSADSAINKQSRQMRYNLTSDRQRRKTTADATANHVSCSGADDVKDCAARDAGNSHNGVDNEQRSAEDQETCHTEITNTDTDTAANR